MEFVIAAAVGMLLLTTGRALATRPKVRDRAMTVPAGRSRRWTADGGSDGGADDGGCDGGD